MDNPFDHLSYKRTDNYHYNKYYVLYAAPRKPLS